MKIVYILKRDTDKTLDDIMKRHGEAHEVMTVDIRNDKNYDRIVDMITSSDRVISW